MANKFLEVAAGDAVKAFVDSKLSGGTDPEALDAAKSKLNGALLQAFDDSDKARKWKPLALPLADLRADGDGLDLSLIAPEANHVAKAGDWTWTLNTKASLAIIADVLDDEQLSTLGLAPRDGHQIVRYAVNGELGAGASGGASAGIWSLKAGAQASAKAALEWYIAGANHRRLGQALLEAVPFMVPPMSLEKQLERAGDFEYWGSTAELVGSLGVSFSASTSIVKSGWTWGFDGERAKLSYSLGISGSARFGIEGLFRLRCIVKEAGTRPDGTKRFGVEVRLERSKSSSKSLALSLSAGIDATALAASADRFLRSQLPDPDKVEDSLALLTQPGTAIRDEVRAALEKLLGDSKAKDLVLLTAGFGDQKALAKSLADRIAAPLVDEIDKLGGKFASIAGNASALIDRWLERAFGGLPIAADLRTKLDQLADAQIAGAKKKFEGAVAKIEGDIKDKTLAAATKLLEPLAALGDKIQAELQDVAAKISETQAADAITRGLAEYAKLRKRVLDVLGDAQRAKIALTLAGTLEDTRLNQTFFRATFVPADDLGAAERLFQALWSGRLDDLVVLVESARRSGAIHGEPEGWLLRASKRVSTASTSINLFGFTIDNKVVKTSELQLQADLAGNVLASGKSTVQADAASYWTERHAKMVLSVVRANASGPAAIEFAFNGAYSAKGRDMTAELFEGMQRALARVAGGSGTLDIRALLKGPDGQSMDDKHFRRNVAFLLPMTLQGDEFRRFLDTAPDDLRRAIVRFGMRALDAEFGEVWDVPPSALLRDLAARVDGQFDDEMARHIACFGRFPSRWSARPSNMSSSVYERLGLDARLMIDGSELHRMLGTMFRLSVLLNAIVELQAQCHSLRSALEAVDPTQLAQSEAAARVPLRAITDALARFSVASQTLVGNSEMVSWPFATFAAAMAQFCGRAVPPGFVACAVLPGQENSPIPLIAG